MKSNLPTILFLISIIFSCNKVDKEKIYGNWVLYEVYESNRIEFDQLYVNSDAIITIDEYLFPERWKYKISQNVIHLRKDNNQLRSIKFENLTKDSIWIDGNKYIRIEDNEKIEYYELNSLKTSKLLEDNLNRRVIHLYEKSNQFTIRCAAKEVEAQEIFQFISNHSKRPPQILLFLGKNIKTKDLIKVYSFLYYFGIRKVKLVTNKNTEGEFEILNDRIDLWSDQVVRIMKPYINKIPPPPPFVQASKQELVELGIPVIKLNEIRDLSKINYNFGNKTVLVSINSNMSLEEYLKVKMGLLELRKKISVNYWTEFV